MAAATARQVNGHATLEPLRLPEHGPVSGWPQRDGAVVREVQANAKSGLDLESGRRHRHAVGGDAAIRVLAAIVVLAVAAFAAIVSYSHIFDLGIHHGQSGTAARLLPLSVDGLIAAASLVMLHAARRELSVPWLARAMLALGVGATVAANVGYGLPFGWLSAVVSAWPAVAFVGSVEMAVRFVRDARQDTAAPAAPPVIPVVTPAVTPARPRPKTSGGGGKVSGADRARAVLRDNPGLTNDALAELAGVDVRTVQRARNGPAKTP